MVSGRKMCALRIAQSHFCKRQTKQELGSSAAPAVKKMVNYRRILQNFNTFENQCTVRICENSDLAEMRCLMVATPVVAVSYPAVLGAVLLAMRKSREDKGMSQAEMAEAVGLNVSTWSRIENGDAAMTIEQLVAAAAALGVKPSSILQTTEGKLDDLVAKGIAAGSSRMELAALAAMGAIPLTGVALVGLLGPVGIITAGVASAAFAYAQNRAKK